MYAPGEDGTREPIHMYAPGEDWKREAIYFAGPGQSWLRKGLHFADPSEEAKEKELYYRVISGDAIEAGTMAKEENQEKMKTTPAYSSDECRINADNGQDETRHCSFEGKRAKKPVDKADM